MTGASLVAQGASPAPADPRWRTRLQKLIRYLPLRAAIGTSWHEPVNPRNDTWSEHRDINEIILETALHQGTC
jgi:hypothetical protein